MGKGQKEVYRQGTDIRNLREWLGHENRYTMQNEASKPEYSQTLWAWAKKSNAENK